MPDHIDLSIAQLLAETDNAERNRLALELADSRDPRILTALIWLIERPDLVDRRGTLLYSLNHFDVSEHILLLVTLVVSGNWEVAHESYDLISSIDHVSDQDVATIRATLDVAAAQDGLDDWQVDLIEGLQSMFD